MLFKLSIIVVLAAFIGCTSAILGGERVNITQVPWQASLYPNGSRTCGGTIIGAQWILTRASCFSMFASPDRFKVLVGSSHVQQEGQFVKVKSYTYHKQNDGDDLYACTKKYDIGLIQLEEKLKFGATIQPIALPNIGDAHVPAGTMLQVSGYGPSSNPDWEQLRYLEAVEVPTLNQESCYNDPPVFEGKFCAGYYATIYNVKGACYDDDGGAAVIFDKKTGAPTAIGIFSETTHCIFRPGTYTRLVEVRQWIQDVTGI